VIDVGTASASSVVSFVGVASTRHQTTREDPDKSRKEITRTTAERSTDKWRHMCVLGALCIVKSVGVTTVCAAMLVCAMRMSWPD